MKSSQKSKGKYNKSITNGSIILANGKYETTAMVLTIGSGISNIKDGINPVYSGLNLPLPYRSKHFGKTDISCRTNHTIWKSNITLLLKYQVVVISNCNPIY